ncbi:hypothetical protein Ancab_026569 [Ancistrocladus abbreviatus]
MESCVPPGFRFHPTDEELVGYYLKKKVASQKIDLDVIRDIDLYRIEPWDLQERCRIGYEEQNEWYFFSHKDKKYPTGTRTNRATLAGFWKATGRDKAVYDKTKLIGMRKTLVFYKGRAPNGQKTDWIMHEYRLESDENGPSQEEGWVVCRAFKKRTNVQSKNIEGWDNGYFYDETSGVSSALEPTDHYVQKHQPQSFLPPNRQCKQELESDAANFIHTDHFVQLPQLESPSLPLLKSPLTSISDLISDQSNNNNNTDYHQEDQDQNKGQEKVTDWRALDKFVASQLMSQDNESDRQGVSAGFGGDDDSYNSEMAALLLLQSEGSRDEDNKLSGLLMSSNTDSDIGICIFDQ